MSEWPKTRKEARALGAKKYFTGKPCKRGHIAPRYVANLVCEVCIREKARARQHAYRANNLDKSRMAVRAWQDNNREKTREIAKNWQRRNPQKAAAIRGARRARRLSATPPWLTPQHKAEIEQKYLLAKLHESVTGIKWHVDHIVPLRGKKVCGLHVPWNLQVIPAKTNMEKHNKFEDE